MRVLAVGGLAMLNVGQHVRTEAVEEATPGVGRGQVADGHKRDKYHISAKTKMSCQFFRSFKK